VNDDEARQPGESEVDHHDRLLRKRAGEEHARKVELIRRFRPPAVQIARQQAERVREVLVDLVGPVEIKGLEDSKSDPTPTTANVTVNITARSNSGKTALVQLTIEPAFNGPDLIEALQYDLRGTFAFGNKFRGADLKIARSDYGQRIVDIPGLRKDIRETAGLPN
jgi:hypothetical protein